MPTRFLDGPAEGRAFDTRRAPMYVRAVLDEALGKWDVLDQPDDVVEGAEVVHVYAAVPGTWNQVFVRPGGCYESADYRHCADIDGDALRDNDSWRAWATAQPAIEMLSPGMKAAIENADAIRDRISRRRGVG